MSASSDTDQRVVTERHGHVLLIRMQRPAKRNAIDPETTAGLDAALDELDDDPGLWCGVAPAATRRPRRAGRGPDRCPRRAPA